MPGPALIAGLAIAGALGGYLGSKKAGKAGRVQRSVRKRARAFATPQHLLNTFQTLLPLFREQVSASGLADQFAANINRSLGISGTGATGVGAALRNASLNAPNLFAFLQALPAAQGVVQNQLTAEQLALGAIPPPAPSRTGATIGGAAQGLLGAFGGGVPGGAPTTTATNASLASFGAGPLNFQTVPQQFTPFQQGFSGLQTPTFF